MATQCTPHNEMKRYRAHHGATQEPAPQRVASQPSGAPCTDRTDLDARSHHWVRLYRLGSNHILDRRRWPLRQ